MHSTNYFDALIHPADDCKAVAKVPDKPGSVAALQYDLMIDQDYERTSDDVLSAVAGVRKGIAPQDQADFRSAFFSKGQPCFRASPLTKTHGWAVHADSEGRVALVSPEGEDYARLSADPAVQQIKAMRNKRP